MTANTLTISCHSAKSQDHALFKSLLGIIAQTAKAGSCRWVYVEDTQAHADVVIVDHDEAAPHAPAAHPGRKPPLVVMYSTDAERVKRAPYGIQKPVRARPLLQLLEMIDDQLHHRNDLTLPSMPALKLDVA